jgi:type 1 glutamine amidotransferase
MKKALIVYGGWDGHAPRETAELFAAWLNEDDFQVDVSDSLEAFEDADKLKACDLIVPVWTMGEITSDQAANVCGAVAEGTGMAGCHGGMCDAFRNNTEWQFMTGGQWVSHPGNAEVTYTVDICNSSSLLTIGIERFEVTSEQYYMHVDPAIEVLATTRFPVAGGHHIPNGPVDIPQVWTKRWGKGRVFYNALGHQPDIWEIPEAQVLMRRGLRWAAR